MFADDNQWRFPMQIPVTNGGTLELVDHNLVSPHFQKLQAYQTNLRAFICPFDIGRQAATNYEALSDSNLSYFLNGDATPTNRPAQTILAGDRILQVKSHPIRPGLFVLTANTDVQWAPGHARGGTLAFADGHAEPSQNDKLGDIIRRQPLATNRLCVP